jgi:hypothetical protein
MTPILTIQTRTSMARVNNVSGVYGSAFVLVKVAAGKELAFVELNVGFVWM